MRHWSRGIKSSYLAVALLLVLLALVGCIEVEVRDATTEASTPDESTGPSPEEGIEHNLAILAVDFEPPLDYQQLIIRRRAIELLVAVENTGTSTERDVTVRARLSTPEDSDLILARGAIVASIAPGEIQVVRFGRMGRLPYHQLYHLEVLVEPVEGETSLGDNGKAFDIEIRQED
jgi:hypothetical protein